MLWQQDIFNTESCGRDPGAFIGALSFSSLCCVTHLPFLCLCWNPWKFRRDDELNKNGLYSLVVLFYKFSSGVVTLPKPMSVRSIGQLWSERTAIAGCSSWFNDSLVFWQLLSNRIKFSEQKLHLHCLSQ
jgi:hypothetical protein